MPHKRSTNIAIGTLVAAGIGYAVGVLTAPRSGKETRKQLQKSASTAISEAERTMKMAYSDLTKLITKGKEKAKNLSAKAKKDLTGALQKAQAVKDQARKILSSIHEGESDDSDLQQVVRDLNKAIKQLTKRINDADKTARKKT